MRSLEAVLASPEGRSFLEDRGVFTEEEEFLERLRAPARVALRDRLGLETGVVPVYAAHQVKADYAPSVVSKLRAAGDIRTRHPTVAAVFLWLDTDRTGADKLTAGLQLHGRGGSVQLRLASRRHDDKEVRFVPVDGDALAESLRRLQAWAGQHGPGAAERSGPLIGAVRGARPTTLAQANMALTSFLVEHGLGLTVPSALVSELADAGLLTEAIDDTVDRIEDVVTVFNAAIDSLLAAAVDPQVRPLRPDYLPLRYSCDRDDRRCTLTREQAGADHFAVTTCACGASYRFHLGGRTRSIAELAVTGRWSTDVTLPMYLNDLAGGVVAGRSSALYGLVLNEVLEKVLSRSPIPMLVPPDLGAVLAKPSSGGPTGGLVAEYLIAE